MQLESAVSVSNKMKPGELIQDILLMMIGVVFAGYALKGFLVPNRFFDGGITGISLLVHELYGFNLAIVIFLLNLPFVVVSYLKVGSDTFINDKVYE